MRELAVCLSRKPSETLPVIGKLLGHDDIRPPYLVEAYRYQALQPADWTARDWFRRLAWVWAEPAVWPWNELFRRYFK